VYHFTVFCNELHRKELESILGIRSRTPGKYWRVSWALTTVPRERTGEYPEH
jgi:hypothetical protein